MSTFCFYFHVHQPWRIKRYRIFDVGHDHHYFNEHDDSNVNNEKILHKVAGKCYIPTNRVLKQLLDAHPEFKFSFSFSGTVLEQLEQFAPDVLRSFQELVATGRVEIVSETYYHSLAFIYSHDEFREQVAMHRKKIKQLFNYEPTAFRNTELIYRNDLPPLLEEMGYKAVLTEGWDPLLGWRSPNFLYRPPTGGNIKIFTKNYKLSDDIAFRFSSKAWNEWPLTAPKFAHWANQVNGNGNVINLFMDYETFGEHQWEDTGIFDFLRALPGELLRHSDNNFATISEAAEMYPAVGEYDVRDLLSWADTERDVSAWIGNRMQQEALHFLYQIRERVLKAGNQNVIDDWRKLSTSDHFYYMCTKWFADGDVHKYFSPYNTPYEAFIAFMNALRDLEYRVEHLENNLPDIVTSSNTVKPVKAKKRIGPARRKKKVPEGRPKQKSVARSKK